MLLYKIIIGYLIQYPQTRTLTGLSYIPLYFYGCKGKLF